MVFRYTEINRLLLDSKFILRTTPVDYNTFLSIMNMRNLLTYVEPSFVPTLYNRYIQTIGQFASKDELPTTAPKLLGLTATSMKKATFFTERGWSEKVAIQKVSDLQNTNSPEAVARRRGCSLIEATEIVAERMGRKTATAIALAGGTEQHRMKKAAIASKVRQSVIVKWANDNNIIGTAAEQSSAYMRHISQIQQNNITNGTSIRPLPNTSLQYYLNQGLTVNEATTAQSNRQRTFSLSKCIEKYGNEEGTNRWQERQNKWQETLNSKPEDERTRIKIAKISNGAFVSNESTQFFKPIVDELAGQFVVHIGATEYYINYNSKFWKYDFCIPELKLIIEYNGTHVHPRSDFDDNWTHAFTRETKTERMTHDLMKHNAAVAKGFEVLYVWSDRDITQQQDMVRSEIKRRIESQLQKELT